MSKTTYLLVSIIASVFVVVLFHFVGNINAKLILRESLLFLTIIMTFVAWKRCGSSDEDKIFWLSLWITLLTIFVLSFINTMIMILTKTPNINDYSMIIYAVGIGFCALFFQSHIETSIPKKTRSIIALSVISFAIAYLVYFLKFSPPLNQTTSNPVYNFIVAIFALVFLGIFLLFPLTNTVMLHIKFIKSYLKSRIELWMATSATYIVLIQVCFIFIKPAIIRKSGMNIFAESLGSYILIFSFVLITLSAFKRIKLGAIEKNKFERYSGRNENRMPKSKS